MKRIILSLVLACLAYLPIFGQGTLHTYYNMNASSFRASSDRTPDGGFIIAGNIGTFNKDVYVTKTDIFGAVQWSRTLAQAQNEESVEVTYNPLDSSYYVLYTTQGFTGSLLKLDLQGQVIWDQPLNLGMDIFMGVHNSSLTITSDNHILISSADIDSTNTAHLGLAKLDAAGNHSWTQFYNIPNNSTFGHDVIESNDGNYVLLGAVDTSYSNGNGNGWNTMLIKTDTAGTMLWQEIYSNISSYNAPSTFFQTQDGGYFISGRNGVGSGQQMMTIKVDGSGNYEWHWFSSGNGSGYNYAYGAVENADSSFTVTGLHYISSAPTNRHLIAFKRLSSTGSLTYQSGISTGQNVPNGKNIYHNPNNGYAIFGVDAVGPFIITVDSLGNLFTNYVYGRAFIDQNNNCLFDSGEPAVPNMIIDLVKNSGQHYTLSSSNNNGSYLMEADSGTYNITARSISPYWQFCQNPQTVNFPAFYGRDTVDFPLQVLDTCTYMQVDLSTPFLRRCFPSTYYVSYSNMGTMDAQNAYVEVELDPFLTYDSCTVPLLSQVGNVYRFDIGTVPMTTNGGFQIHVTVGCDSLVALGQVHCTEAHIYPDTICIPNFWAGSIIQAQSTCNNDTVVFTLENRGTGMGAARNYTIIEEHVMIQINPFQLGSGQSQQISVPALPGAAYRIVAEQENGFPSLLGDTLAISAIVGCNAPPVILNPSIPAQFYNGNSSPFVSVDCQPNRGAFDPNDKQAQPLGYDTPHYIVNNIPLNYHIRFQNTGTDTAFRVVVVDTLSPFVNASSIRPGASSHSYTWELQPGNILVFYFDNIMLPDSNVNEAASHGFIKFEIDQTPNNPDGTVINNSAAIYFDFNAPIITNTVFHTIGSNFVDIQLVGTEDVLQAEVSVKVFPNPFESTATLLVEGADFKELELEIMDITGRVLDRKRSQNNNRIQLDRGNLLQGVYFYRLFADGELLNSGKIMVK